MSNTLLNMSMITREALRVLENNLCFAKKINREYDSAFAQSGAKIGDTLNIRKPARYTVRTGATLSLQNYTETSVPLQLDTQAGVDITFSSKELALSIEDFSTRVLKPAVAAVANKIDRDGLLLYRDVYNAVGTPGTTPSALLTYLEAGEKMDYEATPRDGMRTLCVNPAAQVKIVDALKGLFHSSTEVERQYEMGVMGTAAGFTWMMDQNVVTHTTGAQGGTPLTNGAGQTGTSLVTDGWTSAVATRLKRGDVFTIADVYAVNPQSRESTGQLRQFVVTSDAASDGSGNMTISISPSIVTSGAFQTVNAAIGDNKAITVLGAASTATPQNLAYHRDAFVMGCADLPLPGGVDMASRISDKQLGISLRMIRAYDVNNDLWPCRLDILYGYATVYPSLACRIVG